MIAALRTEYRKFVSTRMWWVLALVMVLYLGFFSAFLSFGLAAGESGFSGPDTVAPQGIDAAATAYSITNPIGYVFPLVIGSLAFTGEFRHKTVTASLLVEPRRTVLLFAKLIASVAIGLFYGVLGTAATVAVAAPILEMAGDGAFLGERETLEIIGFSVIVLMIWTVMGVAIGGVVTNQVAAIVIILATTQFVEPILRFIGALVDGVEPVTRYLPSAAADAVMGASFYGSLSPDGELLSRPIGAAVLLGYVTVFVILSRLITLRRDIA